MKKFFIIGAFTLLVVLSVNFLGASQKGFTDYNSNRDQMIDAMFDE